MEVELVPISEIKTEENVHCIPLSRVEYLAYLATTLSPLEDTFFEADGYTSALFEHMQERKFQEQELFKDYDKLIHAHQGFSLLSNLVQLLLIEKEMRNGGVTNEILSRYERTQREYQTVLIELKKKSSD